MLNLKNTLDGYLKNVEVIGNTIQDTNNLANIRSVGDKVEGQELYKIELACYGDNILRPDFEVGLWNTGNGTAQADSTAIRTKGFLRIRNQAHLVKRFDGKLGCQVILFDENFKYLGQQSYAGGSYVRYDNILPNAKYMKINFLNTTDLNLQCVLFDRVPSNINGVEFVAFQESELEILSPVQLEKVGDVADRIICKDGVWGIAKNIGTLILNENSNVTDISTSGINCDYFTVKYYNGHTLIYQELQVNFDTINSYGLKNMWNTSDLEHFYIEKNGIRVYTGKGLYSDIEGAKEYLKQNNLIIKAQLIQTQFIPLPHDQQVKLRTFAGQTNIAFLTEIPGQIKAQVPKSLGATVNTHTEQIADLHNSLDRVKKLEETTVSTVETESGFTTVNETSNGYFEDVKLEGKTLVNLCKDANNKVNLIQTTTTHSNQDYSLLKCDLNTKYYVILKDLVVSNDSNIFSHIHIGFLDTDWITKVDVKAGRNGVFTLNLANKLPRKLRVQLTKGDVGYTFSYNGIILIPSKDISYEQALELACFEGLMSVGQDVEEVSVESMNENVFDINEFVKCCGGSVDNNVYCNTNAIADNIYPVFLPKGSTISWHVVEPGTANTATPFLGINKNGEAKVIMSVGNQGETKGLLLDEDFYGIQIKKWSDGYKLSNIQVRMSKDIHNYIPHKSNKKPLLYYNPTTETWEKPILREWDTIEKHSDGKYYYHKRSEEVVLNGSEEWTLETNTGYLYTSKHDMVRVDNYTDKLLCDKFNTIINKSHNLNGITGYGNLGQYPNQNWIYIKHSNFSDVESIKVWLKANPTTVVYQLAQEEVYECTNIDLMTYSGETNYIINSGAISPKSLLKVHNNISNVVRILQEKVSLLENTFIAGLRSVLSGDMYSLATILYPEDFEQNDNTEQDIMVIPE